MEFFSSPKQLLASVAIIAGSGIAGFTAAASYVAWKVGYQPAFGAPAFIYEDIQIHWPWRFVQWALWWGQSLEPEIYAGRLIILASLGGGLFTVFNTLAKNRERAKTPAAAPSSTP